MIKIQLKICRNNETKVIAIVIKSHTAKLHSNWGCRSDRGIYLKLYQ